MAQKLITFAVPCYNSAAYMRHCIETLLSAGEQAEIILVDDGSTKDDTPAICDEYAAKYPTIVKAIHQENGGHGEGVNQGIRNATGLYYKVVDSDDWLDEAALRTVLAKLNTLTARGTAPDLMICNYVYAWRTTPAIPCATPMCSRRTGCSAGCMWATSARTRTC